MTEGTEGHSNVSVVVVQPSTPDPKAVRRWKLFWTFADLIAILFWSYALIKIFVFDVDVYLISVANPELVWVVNYKLLIFLGSITVAMLVTRSLILR